MHRSCAMRLRSEHPADSVALFLPDTATYRRLAEAIEPALTLASLRVLPLNEDGTVDETLPHVW